MEGFLLALFGAAIAAVLPGIGSAVGTCISGQAAAAVTSEEPEKFGRLLVMQALPGTQGIYGIVGLFLVINTVAGFATANATIGVSEGLSIFASCLPLAITGLVSGIQQGKVCVAGCNLIAKRGEEFGKGMIYAIVVETYAVLGLLGTILLLGQIKPPTG